jgi:excisionase family DNA binding protein
VAEPILRFTAPATDALPPPTFEQTTERLSACPETVPTATAVYTTAQVAALLQVDVRTLQRWDAAGKIPGKIRLPGRSVRFLRDVIDGWIATGCLAPVRPRRGR